MTTMPQAGTRGRFAYNAAAGGITSIAKILIQLAMLPVMARLLGPAEFGLYGLAIPAISFVNLLADSGLAVSLAREDERSTVVWSTAFWAMLAVCTMIALGVTTSGYVLSYVSNQPRLGGLMAFLSVTFVMTALTQIPAARLVRRGHLVVHSVADFISTLVGTAVALGLALAGAGAWALATQYVVSSALRTAIYNRAAFCLPTREFDLAALWPHVTIGGSVIGSRLAELAGRLFENFVYGRWFGEAGLGTYAFANQTSRFLCDAAGNPVWGALYSVAVTEPTRALTLLRGQLFRLLATGLFPAAALLAAAAPQVIMFALGPKWAGAATLLRILVPAYAITTVASQAGAIMLANGRSTALLVMAAGLALGRIAAVCAAPWVDLERVAYGIDAAQILYAIALFVALGRTTGSSSVALLRLLVAPLMCSVVAALTCYAMLASRPDGFLWTIISISAGAAVYAAGILTLNGRQLMADWVSIVHRRSSEAEQV